jgi:dTDP-4-amino-4,6-dideoxygalactose transaminase
MLNKNYPYYPPLLINKIDQILKSGKVNYWTGNEGILFEKEFSKYVGNKYSIAVSNGSVALEIALKALNFRKNDEIIVTPRSFVISASCVINAGLKPIFADVDLNGNLSLDAIKKTYTKKVKGIIVVHLNGLPCDMDSILNFTKKNKIKLIEDCSQAHGARYKNKSVGSFGDISIWSFCQDKIISTGGEGGMISTNNKRIWKNCWSLKDHGKNYFSVFHKKHKLGFRWLHDYLGSNHRLTEIQSVIGRFQLKELDSQIKKRNQIAYKVINSMKVFWQKYKLISQPNFKCFSCINKNVEKNCTNCTHAFYRLNFYINIERKKKLKLLNELQKNQINCNEGPCPEIYKEKIFKKFKIYPPKKLFNAIRLGKKSITYHVNPYINSDKLKKDIKILNQIFFKLI